MPTADDVLAVAISQLGYREGANNNTKFGAWYGLNYQPWCDMFVSWCFDQAGGAEIGGHFAYCPSHVNWFKNRGQWFTKPQRGDVIFYDWDRDGIADHVGIVETVLDGLYPAAIEGNSSDGNTSEGVAVARHARTQSTILGYGRPAYSSASSSAYRPIPNIPSSSASPILKDWFDMATPAELRSAVWDTKLPDGRTVWKTIVDAYQKADDAATPLEVHQAVLGITRSPEFQQQMRDAVLQVVRSDEFKAELAAAATKESAPDGAPKPYVDSP